MSEPLSYHEALIYVMVTMSAVDSRMADDELNRIGQIVENLPIFANFQSDGLVKTAEACGAALNEEDGLKLMLDDIATALPSKLHETAYAVAVEIAAVDLEITQEELRFLQMLRDRLNIDKLSATAIERGARARHTIL